MVTYAQTILADRELRSALTRLSPATLAGRFSARRIGMPKGVKLAACREANRLLGTRRERRRARQEAAAAAAAAAGQPALVRSLDRIINDATPDGGRLRAILRDCAGATGHSCPVEIVAGASAPALTGNSFTFRWRGKWKAAPGSYIPSTRRVEVGAQWLARRLSEFRRPVTGTPVSPTRRAGERERAYARLCAREARVEEMVLSESWHSEKRHAAAAEKAAMWRGHEADALAAAAVAPVRHHDLDRFGVQGQDDAHHIARPVALYESVGEGLMISHQAAHGVAWWAEHTIVQVVVTDTTTGLRHHLTVPPHFARPLAKGERPCERVHAAIAWTFGLRADEYGPQIEA